MFVANIVIEFSRELLITVVTKLYIKPVNSKIVNARVCML